MSEYIAPGGCTVFNKDTVGSGDPVTLWTLKKQLRADEWEETNWKVTAWRIKLAPDNVPIRIPLE